MENSENMDNIVDVETQPSSLESLSLDESMAKRIRLSLMEDHRWTLTELDCTAINRLANENAAKSQDESNDDSDHSFFQPANATVVENGSCGQARADDEATQMAVQMSNVAVTNVGFEVYQLMIDYIISPQSRLFFCYENLTWRDFCESHKDLLEGNTCDEVRDDFIMRILPKIYSFNLTEQKKKAFDILKFSSTFERIETGYLVCPLKKYAAANMKLVRGIDYEVLDATVTQIGTCQKTKDVSADAGASTSAAAANAMQEFMLDTQKSNPAPPQIAVVVGDRNFYETGRFRKPTELSYENMCLCSAVVSYDYEIYNSVCHTPAEILKRLRRFKEHFARTGILPENFDAEKLIKKITELQKLKETIVEITDQRFSMKAMDTDDKW